MCHCFSAVLCPVPVSISNGRVYYTSLLWGSTAHFQCQTGFRFESLNATEVTSLCLNTTEWSLTPPSCEEIFCDSAPVIPSTNVSDVTFQAADAAAPVNTTLNYTCHDDFRFLDGSSSAILECDVTGRWVGIDSLADTGRCSELRLAEHAVVEDGSVNATLGNTERVICESGFRFVDGSNFSDVTCVDGSGLLRWSGDVPQCERKSVALGTLLCFDADLPSLQLSCVPHCTPCTTQLSTAALTQQAITCTSRVTTDTNWSVATGT